MFITTADLFLTTWHFSGGKDFFGILNPIFLSRFAKLLKIEEEKKRIVAYISNSPWFKGSHHSCNSMCSFYSILHTFIAFFPEIYTARIITTHVTVYGYTNINYICKIKIPKQYFHCEYF